LSDRRGKVVSRAELLARVWGNRYEGGARTVDIHVRRLRAKIGAALPLVTMRGAGYKLTAPEGQAAKDDEPSSSPRDSSKAQIAKPRASRPGARVSR
jgi:DNA-binding winged helix-turn-helix (wHTH) protein